MAGLGGRIIWNGVQGVLVGLGMPGLRVVAFVFVCVCVSCVKGREGFGEVYCRIPIIAKILSFSSGVEV